MNEHTELRRLEAGPRGGKHWIYAGSITHGAFAIRTPGTYKLTHYVNGFATGSRIEEITAQDIERDNPHGWGLELSYSAA